MSISEFSSALQNKAIKEWYLNEANKSGANRPASAKDKTETQQQFTKDNVNNLVNVTSEYRTSEQTSSKTSFIITKTTVAQLLIDLKGADSTKEGFTKLVDDTFKKFLVKDSGIKVNRRRIHVGKDLPAVYFNSISFDSITNLVNNILNLQPKQLAEYYEKGHVISINTALLKQTQDRIREINTQGTQGKNVILDQLDKVIEYYARLDLESANIKSAEPIKVYASAKKILTRNGAVKYLVELQPKAMNQRSADEVKATIGSIRKLFSPGLLTEKGMVSTIDKLLKIVSDDKFKKDLLQLRSSPNLVELISEYTGKLLTGKTIKDEISVVPAVSISSVKVPKPDLAGLRQEIKKEKNKAAALRKKIKQKVAKKPVFVQYSLVSLQNLINSNLAEKIKENMGDGNARNVLNLRSGRLAESAQVERMSESRAGMITAFYSYMKNPYATFSAGGRQQDPKSRDPKLLIAKSIREIAAQQVGNRLRSVLV